MAKESGRESDPLIVFNFALELQGSITGYFTECSGIGSEHEIVEHKVVNDSGMEIVQKIPGRLKWQDVTLKRGITGNMEIWDWRAQVEKGEIGGARKTCSVIMFDRNYKEIARWNFENAWPSKVTGPSPKSDSNEFALEEVTLVHEGMWRVS
jgi:phage tail-like protein